MKHLSLLFCILCAAIVTNAHSAEPPDSSAVFSCITINDGLSSNTVRALLQDRLGFIWLGTSRGLNRYDGNSIATVKKTHPLSITSLAEIGDTIWVGTENGLYLYLQRADSIARCKAESGGASSGSLNISDMTTDGEGNLWIATMNMGIMRLDRKTSRLETIATPDGGKAYGCIHVSRQGDVWAASNWENVGLVKYDKKSNCFKEYRLVFDGDTHNNLTGIALTDDDEGMMWLGTWSGALVRFAPTSHKAELHSSLAGQAKHIHSLHAMGKGNMLIGSDDGLVLYDFKSGKTTRFNRQGRGTHAISDDFVYPILTDHEGGTWIGTYYGGANYTHPASDNFTSYSHSKAGNSVSGNVVNHFCEDRQNRLWIASDDGGLCFYDPATQRFTSVPLSADGDKRNVHALCIDGDRMYVGTYAQGIDIVDLKTLRTENIPKFFDEKGKYFDASSFAIYRDNQHRIWVGSFRKVALFHPDTRTFSDATKVGGPVTEIMQDHTGVLWVATEANALWAHDTKGRWKHYLDFDSKSLPDGTRVSANSILEDGSGTLWVGTTNGLFHYDRKADSFVKARLTANNIAVYGIAAVEGNLWLTTSAGILCYSLMEREVVQVYKGGGNISSIDFLPDAIFLGYDGRIYIGTTNGFVAFYPQFMRRNDVKPRVMFTGLDIFNRPADVGSEILPERMPYMDKLRLSFRETVFRLSFSALSYLHPSDITYSYYLEEFDEDWNDAGNQHSITYTNLSPGKYTFHVRAVTNNGTQSDEALLPITITPPFYWNTPAQIVYILIIVLTIFFYVRHLLSKKERKHVAEIKEINAQKEQEIQEINVQKEQEIHDARIKFMTLTDKDQAFLDKFETVIEQNFSNSGLSVDYIASELNVSRSGLFAKIKALADVTPNEMIQVIRLKHAASLLSTGNYRVNEVCYMVGFSSPSYFGKCFQKQYGCTPTKYKET